MGGGSLKNTNCIRLNKELYENIKLNIINKLSIYNNFEAIIEAPEKETFGDLDLIYIEKEGVDIKEIVNNLFSPNEVFGNDNLYSFSYKINDSDYFQIDLIKVSNINLAQFYYGYGGLGEIIGITLRNNNLVFGYDGIWVNYVNKKLILLTDPEKICNFINLDYNKWKEGFKTKIDFYNWIIKCKYFNKDDFDINTFNSIYLGKYKKRPYFKSFVDFVNKLEMEPHKKINYSVDDYINMFHKGNNMETIDKQIYIERMHREKLSAQVFALYTEPKNINKYKNNFKEYISKNNDIDEWLINNNKEYISNQIKEYIINNPI